MVAFAEAEVQPAKPKRVRPPRKPKAAPAEAQAQEEQAAVVPVAAVVASEPAPEPEPEAPKVRTHSLKRWREHRGLTQMDLAALADISLGVVQKLEGTGRVTPQVVEGISRALNVPPEQITELRSSIQLGPGRPGRPKNRVEGGRRV